MEPKEVRQDIEETDSIERPSFVLVQHGAVIAHFGPDEAENAADTAYRMTNVSGASPRSGLGLPHG
jgi:hypothetical protein